MSYCTRQYGVTAATVPNKLSLVIPVLFSIALYNEEVSMLKIGGVLLAIPAIYLTSRTDEKGKQSGLFIPLLLFVSSGLLDTMLKYIEQKHLPDANMQAVFIIHIFLFAALFGTVVMITMAIRSNNMFKMRDVLAGLILGVPNYYSVYYFIRFLNSNVLESSAAIPVNNICIVVVSSLAAMIFLKEKPAMYRIAGLGLAVIAILMIAFS
jgi:drug/metabolite transporter (DMT)-like permease